MELTIKANKEDIYNKYLSVLTGGSGLSGKERLILGELMKYTEKHPDDPAFALNSSTRRKIEKKINMSSFNFNNYIGALKLKKAVIQLPESNDLIVNPRLIPKIVDNKCEINFKFVINE